MVKAENLNAVCTCGSSFQSWPKGRHKSWISNLSRFSHADLEGTAGYMAAVEANVYRVNAVLLGDEPDGVPICWKTKKVYEKLWQTEIQLFFLVLWILLGAVRSYRCPAQ